MGQHRSREVKQENTARPIPDSIEEIAAVTDPEWIMLDANQSMGGSMKITFHPELGTRVTVQAPLMIHPKRPERREDHED